MQGTVNDHYGCQENKEPEECPHRDAQVPCHLGRQGLERKDDFSFLLEQDPTEQIRAQAHLLRHAIIALGHYHTCTWILMDSVLETENMFSIGARGRVSTCFTPTQQPGIYADGGIRSESKKR